MAEQPEAAGIHRTVGGNLGVSRRGFMRATAATAGAVTVGYGSTQVPRYSPVGRAAAHPLIAVGIAAAGLAGLVVYDKFVANDGEDPDFTEQDDSQAELEIWNLVNSVQKTGRSTWRDVGNSYRLTYVDAEKPWTNVQSRNDDHATNFADAAWSQCRTEVAREFNDGGDATTATERARAQLDVMATSAAINLLEDGNAQVEAIASSMYETKARGLTNGIKPITKDGVKYSDFDGWAGAPGNQWIEGPSGENMIGKLPVTFPADLADVPDADPDANYGAAIFRVNEASVTSQRDVYAVPEGYTGSTDVINHNGTGNYTRGWSVGVSGDVGTSYDPKVVWNPTRWIEAFKSLNTAYHQIRTDVQDYANAVADQISAGDLDPDDLLTGRDIVNQYSDAESQTTRLMAELAASGLALPSNLGDNQQVTVNHAALLEERTGWLYLNLTGTQDLTVQEGGQIAAADYTSAYLVSTYEDNDGNEQTRADMLSPTRQEDVDDDGTKETVNQPIDIVGIEGDATELTYKKFVRRVEDPQSGEDINAEVQRVSELRNEIEALREEIAAEEGGGGGGGFLNFGEGGSKLGIAALAVALGALLLGGSED